MRRIRNWQWVAATAATVAVVAACPMAQASGNPPILRTAEGVEFMAGGGTPAEAAFLDRVAPRWAATFEFGIGQAPRGAFALPAQVRVRDRVDGQIVLQARSQGPMLLARLEPGSYDVEASLGSLTLIQSVTVLSGVATRLVFVWPSNLDLASIEAPPRAQAQLQRATGN